MTEVLTTRASKLLYFGCNYFSKVTQLQTFLNSALGGHYTDFFYSVDIELCMMNVMFTQKIMFKRVVVVLRFSSPLASSAANSD